MFMFLEQNIIILEFYQPKNIEYSCLSVLELFYEMKKRFIFSSMAVIYRFGTFKFGTCSYVLLATINTIYKNVILG